MADEIRGTPSSGPTIGDDPEAARAEIEQTRRRMSSTLDELGDALQRKKGQLQERLDLMAPVRENPLRTVGMVFGAGLVLGFLTGGEEEEEEHDHRRMRGGMDSHWRERSEMWEGRARRLLHIAREQDEELEALRPSHRRSSRRRHYEEDEHEYGRMRPLRRMRHRAEERFDDMRDSMESRFDDMRDSASSRFDDMRDSASSRMDDLRDSAESRFDDVRDAISHAVSDFVGSAVRQLSKSLTS